MQKEINTYYDRLAPEYDSDRFGNTYGQYIDYQEKNIVTKLLPNNDKDKTLDLACGTGRFLPFARCGLDASRQMLRQAQAKHPDALLTEGNALATPFADQSFRTVLSFHFVMHLNKAQTTQFLTEALRIMQTGGRLIFDFPSKSRRQLINYQAKNWHAANDLSVDEIRQMASDQWQVKEYYGILFFPIHRIPTSVRRLFVGIDNLLCRSFLKKYASYILIVLEKK